MKSQRGVPETDWRDLFPALCLIVSGGHTSLYWVKSLEHPAKFELVGRTRDDAAGEAFDKVAKLLHLGYPGGPIIDRLSKKGNAHAIDLPISKISDGKLDFSFSGIKTAVLRYVQAHLQKEVDQMASRRNEQNFHDSLPQPVYDLIASFQRTAIEMLFDKAFKSCRTSASPIRSRVRRRCLQQPAAGAVSRRLCEEEHSSAFPLTDSLHRQRRHDCCGRLSQTHGRTICRP